MNAERQKVIQIAKTWLGTPYHHHAQVKGAGSDCATFIAEVFFEAGLVKRFPIENYNPQWHLHRNAEKYMGRVLEYAREVETPQPGDIVIWKFGRTFSHGAIVVDWPSIIHQYITTGCVIEDAVKARYLSKIGESGPDRGKNRPVRFFSHWRD